MDERRKIIQFLISWIDNLVPIYIATDCHSNLKWIVSINANQGNVNESKNRKPQCSNNIRLLNIFEVKPEVSV